MAGSETINQLQKKIIKILGLLFLIRLGLYIPVPNVDLDLFLQLFNLWRKDLKIKTAESNSGSPERRCPDLSKFYATIPYKPSIGLSEGLRSTYEWYKENVFEGSEISAK